jgi:hypothetical protein
MATLTIIVLAIGIHFWRNAVVMMVVIPLSMFCAFTGYNTIVKTLGYPIQQTIPDDALYLYHIESIDGEHLYVYAIEPEKVLPKNFKIPATEQNRSTMSEAKRRTERGIKQLLRGDSKKKRNGERNDGEYLRYDFKIDSQGLKSYNK